MTGSKRRVSLESPSIRLRRIHKREVPLLEIWLQDPKARFFLNPEDPIILDARSQVFLFKNVRKMLKDPSRERRRKLIKPIDLQFAVLRKEDDQLVGLIVLKISLVHKVGTVRTLIARQYRKQGFGKEAKRVLLDYAFLDLNLAKMRSEFLETHKETESMNLELGFREEGKLKDQVEISDIRLNLIVMAILRDEWLRKHYPHLL